MNNDGIFFFRFAHEKFIDNNNNNYKRKVKTASAGLSWEHTRKELHERYKFNNKDKNASSCRSVLVAYFDEKDSHIYKQVPLDYIIKRSDCLIMHRVADYSHLNQNITNDSHLNKKRKRKQQPQKATGIPLKNLRVATDEEIEDVNVTTYINDQGILLVHTIMPKESFLSKCENLYSSAHQVDNNLSIDEFIKIIK